jgi:hypothetical protein
MALAASTERTFAQGWNADARKLALGGVGTSRNIASELIEPDPKYRAIFVPLGLLQLVGNLDKFDPNSDNFDPIRAMEYVANPYHFTIGRNDESAGRKLVTDILNGKVQTDLNAYRGFIPPKNPRAEGIVNFSLIHKTFKISTGGTTFQGVYVGVGPYFTHRTSLELDQKILDILSSSGAPLKYPNDQYLISVDRTTTQMAGALTFGYRAHMALPAGVPSQGTDREGVYLGVNYSYLRGFYLEDDGLQVRFDTDNQGNILLDPTKTLNPCPTTNSVPGGPYGTPFCTDRRTATSGTGRSIDFGVATVFGPWELGFGVNGLANFIEWDDPTHEALGFDSAQSLTSGSVTFVTTNCRTTACPGATNVNTLRIEQPRETLADATYHASFGTVMAEVGSGYQGKIFHGGFERQIGPLFGRAGMRYTNEKWNPSVGAGFNFFPRLGLDFAYLTSTANAEKERQSVLAVSIRINAGS